MKLDPEERVLRGARRRKKKDRNENPPITGACVADALAAGGRGRSRAETGKESCSETYGGPDGKSARRFADR